MLLSLLLASCGVQEETAVQVTEPGEYRTDGVPQLRREGRWLVDHHHRVVLLHGVNLVWKHAPYVPPQTAEGFIEADADWLVAHGFNSARIGTLWSGIAPVGPDAVDADYLDAWDRVVQMLAARGIWTLFDFHQDMLGPRYQGEGVPDWAVEQLAGRYTRWFGAPTRGFPFNYFTPQLSQAFDRLWDDRGVVREGFRNAWMAVARHWHDQPYSMGYDLFNEPWAGLDYSLCLVPMLGCPHHDAKSLQPFFEYARAGIRELDPDNLIWFQSQPLTSVGAPSGFVSVPGEHQLGYAFHYYCPLTTLASATQGGKPRGISWVRGCDAFGPRVFAEALQQAQRMNAVALLTEFGATDDLEVLRQVMALADQQLLGWQYWHYKNWRDPTTESQGSGAQGLFSDDADLASVKPAKLRVLQRAYPQATAGIPLQLSFDIDSGRFEYRYRPHAATAATEIYLPLALHYPDGYQAEISGARVLSAANTSPLLLEALPDATEVAVIVARLPADHRPPRPRPRVHGEHGASPSGLLRQ
jgi:endoglycosylceramidase